MEIELHVGSGSRAEASRLADELHAALRANVPRWVLSRKRTDDAEMDLGTILIAVLSAQSVVQLAKDPAVELAKGIADWMRKRRATLSIGKDGKIVADNIRPEDVLPLIKAALDKQR